MIKKAFLFLTLFLFSCSEQVDLIVYNAEIYTVDENNDKATSFAVKDGKFVMVSYSKVINYGYRNGDSNDGSNRLTSERKSFTKN